MNDTSNTIKKTEDAAKNITNPDNKFKGYTLEEIRYQRALVTLQKEFCKTKMARNVRNMRKTNPLSPEATAASLPGKVGFVASKLFRGLSYLDYAMLGFSFFSSVRKVYSFFHRKKK